MVKHLAAQITAKSAPKIAKCAFPKRETYNSSNLLLYKKDKKASGVIRKIVSLTSGRDIAEEDKYLRDIITVTANARNVGLE